MWSFWGAVKEIDPMSFLVGEDDAGRLICRSFNDVPHLLVSGATGTGKSVFLHSFIASIIIKNNPSKLRLVLYDSKKVEFCRYTGEAHLLLPTATDAFTLSKVFDWCQFEIENRLSAFVKSGKRSLLNYNNSFLENEHEAFPVIVIVIDDLSVALSETPELFEKIRYVFLKGRIAGFHLILASQTTTGKWMRKIVELVPSKLVFSVPTEKESLLLIGNRSARLLGPYGTAIFSPFRGNSVKIKTLMAEDDDICNILAASKKVFAEFVPPPGRVGITESACVNEVNICENEGVDELFSDAVEVIFETGQASVSMIQRRLKLGYSRAARLVDEMERLGIIGEFKGSVPRSILITKQQWEQIKR